MTEGNPHFRAIRAALQAYNHTFRTVGDQQSAMEAALAAAMTILNRNDEADMRSDATVRGALAWYGEQARRCRFTHGEGVAARRALDADGGERARAALGGDHGK